jgi:hypothetical protein
MTDHMPARDALPTRTPGSTFTHKWTPPTPPTPPPGPTCDCPPGQPIPTRDNT